MEIQIDGCIQWIDFRRKLFDENFSFPVHSLLLKGGSKGTFLDMLREKLRLMMLRDVTTFSTSSLVLSAPSPPPRKYDNRGSRWTTLISPISNYRFFLTFYILVHISLAFQIFTRNKIYTYRDTIINTSLNVKIPRCSKSKSLFTFHFQSTRSNLLLSC